MMDFIVIPILALLAATAVCKTWAARAKSNSLWRPLVLRRWPLPWLQCDPRRGARAPCAHSDSADEHGPFGGTRAGTGRVSLGKGRKVEVEGRRGGILVCRRRAHAVASSRERVLSAARTRG